MLIKSLTVLLHGLLLVIVHSIQTFTAQSGTVGPSMPVTSSTSSTIILIQPANPSSQSIQFVFQSMNVGYAQLKIYDSNAASSGNVLFNCVSCGNIIPPAFFSSTGSVYVSFVGNSGSPFVTSTFSLQYFNQPSSSNPQLNNITTNLNAGYGKISPQYFNNVIAAKSVQRWVIQTPGQNAITFSFSSFNMGTSCSSQIQIFNDITASGQLIYSGCQNSDQPQYWFYSNTGKALVVLTTSSAASSAAFVLTYIANAELWGCGAFLQPDNLKDDSMILTDGSSIQNYMRRGQQCQWLINPSNAGTVTLVLWWVSLKAGGSIIVYDGATANGNQLWNVAGPSFVTPPPLISSGASMTVVFTSNTYVSDGYYGFRGAYSTNYYGSVGIGQGSALMTMSAAIDITPPGDSIYATPNIAYTWYIQPSLVSTPLTFVVSALNLSATAMLTIYDGDTTDKVLARYTGTHVPSQWIKTSSSVATMQFQSAAASGQKQGNFRVTYFGDGDSYHCGFPTSRTASLVAPSSSLYDGTAYTHTPLVNQQCNWNIQPTNAVGVFLYFNYFNLVGGTLTIYNGPVSTGSVVATISGPAIPAPLLLQSSVVGVSYTTSSKVSGFGFSASYFGISTSNYRGPGDGIVRLYSSSMTGVTNAMYPSTFATTAAAGGVLPAPGSNVTWFISTKSSVGGIYLALTKLNFSGSGQRLEIYDGPSLNSPLLGVFNGSTLPHPYQWIKVTSNATLLRVVASNSFQATFSNTRGSFSLAYYSDGPNFQCGYTPGSEGSNGVSIMAAPSMIITDGSPSNGVMFANQFCQWKIVRPPNATTIVLEFLQSDLRGAQVQVFNGVDANAPLLWSCFGCTVIPRNIVSRSKAVFLQFSSFSSPIGLGFRAVYWTTRSKAWQNAVNGTVLELPNTMTLDSTKGNLTTRWSLQAVSSLSQLTYFPRVATAAMAPTLGAVSDGRKTTTTAFASPPLTGSTCGFVRGRGSNALSGPVVYQAATQYAASYVQSSAAAKTIRNIAGSWNVNNQVSPIKDFFEPANVCKYELTSGSQLSILINLNHFTSGGAIGRLRIFGGLYGNDALLFDSNALPAASVESKLPVHMLAPCGKALVILDYNTSIASATQTVNYGFNLTYMTNPDDTVGYDCYQYFLSLQPHIKKTNPWIKWYIAAGVVGFVLILAIVLYCNRRRLPDISFKWPTRVAYQAVTPDYPRYTPKLDEFRNKFLKTGQCCVCQEPAVKVIRLKCNHGICLEDLKGYVESALGNISLFPVKCPMHYEACEGGIDATLAKRILTKIQYDKFIEFSDRALYGEGMRCIFCNNFVNLPEIGNSNSMVECPYCVQRFCLRCKKPWHYGAKCPLDNVDDSLEAWKTDSGAQKCPACHKLIEKDDPDTCNHMVHKFTDGIPCVRDRTDFCYCCGEEVAPDYPHDEINNPGVNHFPDGVFQKCRILVKREQDAERERLKKLRRMKNKGGKSPTKVSQVAMDDWDSDEEGRKSTSPKTPSRGDAGGGGGGGGGTGVVVDQFDAQWSLALGGPSTPTASISGAGSATASPQVSRRGRGGGGGRGGAVR